MLCARMPAPDKMLGTIKRKQVEKYNKSPAAKREEIECNSYTILHQALENCKPIIGLASVQKGEKSYQVPIPLTDDRRTHRYEKLSQELLAAFTNEGNVVKRKRDLHKMAEANRAYAHYRWW